MILAQLRNYELKSKTAEKAMKRKNLMTRKILILEKKSILRKVKTKTTNFRILKSKMELRIDS